MNNKIVEFRQKLRSDILHFLYERFFCDGTFKFYSVKDIHEKLSYPLKCPDGLLYTFELNGALAYLKELNYLTVEGNAYSISTNGIDYLESLYNEQTDNIP